MLTDSIQFVQSLSRSVGRASKFLEFSGSFGNPGGLGEKHTSEGKEGDTSTQAQVFEVLVRVWQRSNFGMQPAVTRVVEISRFPVIAPSTIFSFWETITTLSSGSSLPQSGLEDVCTHSLRCLSQYKGALNLAPWCQATHIGKT